MLLDYFALFLYNFFLYIKPLYYICETKTNLISNFKN